MHKLTLQLHRELKARDDKDAGYAGVEESLVLLPLEVMVKPLELRFRYHFDGERPTNRPDKVSSSLSLFSILVLTYAARILPVPCNKLIEYLQRVLQYVSPANSMQPL